MCEKNLLEFVSDVMIVREFYFFLKLLNVILQIYPYVLKFLLMK